MKKIFFVFLFLCGLWIVNSQTYRFYYEIKFKKDSLAKEHTNEVAILDIGKDKVKFYPSDILEKDSIRLHQNVYEFSYSKLGYKFIREKGTYKNMNYVSLTPNYYRYETYDEVQWNVLAEKKTIAQFTVQKATTNFGGRNWEAWFTTDIPFQEGPYKFRGLPGLIVELSDTQEHYIFQLWKTKVLPQEFDTSFYVENTDTTPAITITEKKMTNLLLDYYTNPLKDFETQSMVVEDKNGNVKTLNAKELTEMYQKQIRKNNNPIELNKAIVYPVK